MGVSLSQSEPEFVTRYENLCQPVAIIHQHAVDQRIKKLCFKGHYREKEVLEFQFESRGARYVLFDHGTILYETSKTNLTQWQSNRLLHNGAYYLMISFYKELGATDKLYFVKNIELLCRNTDILTEVSLSPRDQ